MLSEQDYEQYLDDLKLDKQGRYFISTIRSSPPARAVGVVRKHNICGQFFSEKMGCLIQYESRTGEALFALDAEYQDEILEFYDQPVTVPIAIIDKRGRRNRVACTPDYMVLRQSGITFYEVKPRGELEKLALKRPIDWVQEDEIFHYKPAEAAFRELGFAYEVVVAEDLSQKRAHNIRLLLRSRQQAITPRDQRKLDRLVEHVERYGPLPMDRALSDVDEMDSSLAIIAIDRGRLVADINNCLLSGPRSVWLAINLEELSTIDTAAGGYLGAGVSITSILEADFPRPGEHQRIVQRLAMINGSVPIVVHPATVRRWKHRLANGGGSPAALASHYGQSGRRGPRIHQDHLAHLLAFHKQEYATNEARSERAVHRQYAAELTDAEAWTEGWGPPVCLETYSKLVSTLDPEAIQRKRGGTPAGNAAARPVNPDKVGLTAQYAFEIGQIDHYLADCFVVVAKTAKKIYCARPWVTLMIDTYSKCVIGLWVGLSAPSRKACAMVFRDCAKRHGRLPKCIRVDNGSDFQSVHFDALIAYLHLSKEYRPASDPRYGSEVERVFNTIRTQFLDDQLGHLRNNERNRAVANAFKGEAVAALDMEFFYQFLEKYIFDDYNAHLRTVNTKAPCIVLQDSLDRLKIAGVEMVLDAKLMLATAHEAPSKRYRLSYVDGIRVEQNRYRSSEMFAMLARGTSKAEIKLEPYDDTFIYVHDVDRECWHIATKISASLDLAPTDLRPDFDALMRREGKSILKGVKQDRDRYYVAKRKENLKVLKAAGIDFLDLTDQPKSEDSITQMTSPSRVSPDPTQLRSIEQFVGFA